MNTVKLLSAIAVLGLLAGCSTFDRLPAGVNQAPKLSAIENPTAQPGYRKINMPMPEIVAASYQPNSLFSNEARGFFKDQRAHRIGDILTVIVTIDDSAQISNATTRKRSASNEANIGTSLGSVFGTNVPGVDVGASGDITTGGAMSDGGNGSVNRKESLQTNVAVVVTQVLPNGNLVIEGRQEVRVNFEVPRPDHRRHRAADGHPVGQHHHVREDRRGPHLLRRTRPDHRCAAAALRPAGLDQGRVDGPFHHSGDDGTCGPDDRGSIHDAGATRRRARAFRHRCDARAAGTVRCARFCGLAGVA